MVRFLLPDEIRIYGADTFSGSVFSDVGFDLDHTWDEYPTIISAENIETVDTDVIFTTALRRQDTAEFTEAFGAVERLWNAVPAVADGRQHWFDDDMWMLGIGPTGAGLILDDPEATLTR